MHDDDEARPLAPGISPERAALPIRSFDFSTDAAGRIDWCEARVAPMVCGIDLSEFPQLSGCLRQHQPIRAARVSLAGGLAVAGAWQIDASPSFAPQRGQFLGHIGRFRRPAALAEPRLAVASEADRLRQVLHELRNPVNAIQGFAEIIQQQLFGPAPHEYRALAAVIAADSARMLASFAELDRLAGLTGRTLELAAGESDLAACVKATILRLKPYSEPRATSLRLRPPPGALPLPLAPIETERLCWRLLATLAACASPGETLHLELTPMGSRAELTMQLPAHLAELDDDALLHARGETAAPLSAGMFGTGFAFRLAASEARAAGGRLERHAGTFTLSLPVIDADGQSPAISAPAETEQQPVCA